MVGTPRFSFVLVGILSFLSGTGGHAHGVEPPVVSAFSEVLKSRWLMRTLPVSDTVIEFQGLTVVQVSQNQAAVISDPQNRVFVIRNSGFVAFAVEGTYSVLSVVDQTHLPNRIKDHITGVVLGHTHEVTMKSRMSAKETKDYVVALL